MPVDEKRPSRRCAQVGRCPQISFWWEPSSESSADTFAGFVVKRHRANILMLVGHEPDFTNVISGLTGASLKLSKAGVALVEVDPESEEGKLLWLLPPKIGKK